MGKKIKKIKTCIFVSLLLLFVFWSGGIFAQQIPDILDLTVPEHPKDLKVIGRIFKVKKGATLIINEENVKPKYSDVEYAKPNPDIIVTVILEDNIALSKINEKNPLFYIDFKYNNISHVNVSGPTLDVYKKIKYLEGSRTKIAILDSEAFFFIPTLPMVLKNQSQFLLYLSTL